LGVFCIAAEGYRNKIDLQNLLKRTSNQIDFVEVENSFRFS
jgi:hypothetical protein